MLMAQGKKAVLKIPMAASRGGCHTIRTIDAISDNGIENIIITMNTTPQKYLKFRTPLQAFMEKFGTDIKLCFK